MQVSLPELLFWALAVAGTALVLTQSSLTRWIRDGLARAATHAAKATALDRAYAARRREDPTLPRARRRWHLAAASHPLELAAKLVACPMCSGFWIGAVWAHVLGVCWPWLFAFGCGGSYAAAIGVAAWQLAGEAHAAIGVWRFLHTPPPGIHPERLRLAEKIGQPAAAIKCPRFDCPAVGGEECRP